MAVTGSTTTYTDPSKKATVAALTTPAANQAPTAPRAEVVNKPVDAQGNTQYVQLGGKDLNEILYLKSLYEGQGASSGQKSWAANQAGQYYANLDPALAAQVKGMNAQQLNDYIAGLAPKPADTGGAATGAPGAAATNPAYDMINQIRDLSAQNLNAQAYDARNQADALNLQNAQRMQEIMFDRGLGQSGENITAMLNQNAQRQGAQTDINNQLSQNLTNLDINRAQQLMEQYNIDEDRALQVAQLMGDYRGQKTLGAKSLDFDIMDRNRVFDQSEKSRLWGEQMDVADLLGMYNGQRTLQGQSFDLNKQNTLFNQEMDTKRFDEDVRQFGLNYALSQQAQRQAAANAAADNSRQWAALNWSMSADNPDNIYRNLQIKLGEKELAGIDQGGMSTEDLRKEASSMLSGLRSGSLTPDAALQQIQDDQNVGIYSPANADYLRKQVFSVSPTFAQPELEPEQIAKLDPNMKSDKEIEAEAKAKGLPTLDYRSWYKSPDGRLGGRDYQTWKKLFGPKLTAK